VREAARWPGNNGEVAVEVELDGCGAQAQRGGNENSGMCGEVR
jgi:hypothetical protein